MVLFVLALGARSGVFSRQAFYNGDGFLHFVDIGIQIRALIPQAAIFDHKGYRQVSVSPIA